MVNFRNALSRTLTITRAYLTVSPVAALDPGIADQNPSALGADSSEELAHNQPRSANVPFADLLGCYWVSSHSRRTRRSLTATARIIISLFSAPLRPPFYRKGAAPTLHLCPTHPHPIFFPGRHRAYGRLSLAAKCGTFPLLFQTKLPEHIFRTQRCTESDIAETLPPASAGRLSSETVR